MAIYSRRKKHFRSGPKHHAVYLLCIITHCLEPPSPPFPPCGSFVPTVSGGKGGEGGSRQLGDSPQQQFFCHPACKLFLSHIDFRNL